MTIPRAVLLLLIASHFLAPSAAADGFALKFRDISSLRSIAPNQQSAVIVVRDGRQHMLIALNLALSEDEHAIWMFPVRGDAADVKLDLVDQFPRLFGVDPRREAAGLIDRWAAVAAATQCWPVVALVPSLSRSLELAGLVDKQVDRWGINAAVLRFPSTLDQLAATLAADGLDVTKDQLASFGPYLNTAHSLVLCRLTSLSKLRKEFPDVSRDSSLGQRRPCVYVEFPSAAPWYPMRATAAYGEAVVPVVLFVGGFVEPRADAALASTIHCRHFRLHHHPEHVPPVMAAAMGTLPIDYTVARFSTEARFFTSDIDFAPTTPPGSTYVAAIEHLQETWLIAPIGIVAIAGLSMLSAWFAGQVTCRRTPGIAWLGLWNFGTIVAVMFAGARLSGERGERLRRGRPAGRFPLEFALIFSLIFVVLCVAARNLLMIPLRI